MEERALHDFLRVFPDKVVEGDSRWVLQGELSRVSCRRQPLCSQKNTVLSLHISNVYAKKRSIGKKITLTIRTMMLEETTWMWLLVISTGLLGDATLAPTASVALKKTFADSDLPMPLGSTLL